jgi:hypothetical protein
LSRGAPDVEEAVRAFIDGRVRSDDVRPQVDVRQLEVLQVTGDRATADIDASAAWKFTHPVHGEIVRAEDLSGPVELELDQGRWRIVDVVVNGRPLSRSRTALAGSIEQSGLCLRDFVLELGARATSLELVAENRGAHPLVVFEVLRGARVLGLWSYTPVPMTTLLQIAPGEQGPVRAGWRETFRPETDELRFVVRAGEVEGSGRFELHFAARRAPAAEVVAKGHPPWSARLSLRRRRWLQLAPLAVFGALLVLRWFRAAGIVFALEGLAFAAAVGYLWLIRRRGRPDSRLVVAALATIAVGVWLAWLDPS